MRPVVPVLHGGNEGTQEGTGTVVDFAYLLALAGGVEDRLPCVVDLGDMCAEIGGRARTWVEASAWGDRREPLGKPLNSTIKCCQKPIPIRVVAYRDPRTAAVSRLPRWVLPFASSDLVGV